MPHRYDLTVSPTEDANVPDGDGYYLYNSLLDGVDDRTSLESLAVSMLMDGPFRSGTEPHTKRVLGDESYRVRVSITDDAEEEALNALLDPYLNDSEWVDLNGTLFSVTDYVNKSATMTDIWEAAVQEAGDQPEVRIQFNTPTCIVHPRSTITEMFPHRRSIFPQLASEWNQALDRNENSNSELKFALDPFEVGAQVFEKPRAESYRTYSTLTDVRKNADGKDMPFFRQGYIGTCSYGFRKADDHMVGTILALARFAEYNGVGADTRHGCGCVNVEFTRGGR